MLLVDLLLVLAVAVFAAVLYWPSVEEELDDLDGEAAADLAAEPVVAAAAD